MAQGGQGQELPGQQGRDQPRGAQGLNTEDGRLHALCKEGKYNRIEEFIRNYESDLPSKLAYRRGVFGYTPIHEAVSSGHSKVLELLLGQEGSDPNCRANSGYTPLHLAASSGHVDCVRVLLANNADIANTDEYGKTPIQTAELSSKHSVMKVLRSADLSTSSNGATIAITCVGTLLVSITVSVIVTSVVMYMLMKRKNESTPQDNSASVV